RDVGKLVQARFLQSTMKLSTEPPGTNHAEIGACVLDRWGFPAPVVEAARHHLDAPEAFEELELPRESFVVAAMCRLAREGAVAAALGGVVRRPADGVVELGFQAQN